MGHSEEKIFESVDGRRTSEGLGKGKKMTFLSGTHIQLYLPVLIIYTFIS